MLLVRGVNVYPHAIKDVIASLAPRVTGLFKIVLDAPPPVVEPPVELRVEIAGGEDEAGVARDIEDRIHELLRFRARVETVSARWHRKPAPGRRGLPDSIRTRYGRRRKWHGAQVR